MNSFSIFLTVFVFSLNLILPAATWLTHRHVIQADAMSRLWYRGVFLHAVVTLLVGLRPVVPAWVGFHGAALVWITSVTLMLEAIRRELQMRPVTLLQGVVGLVTWVLSFSLFFFFELPVSWAVIWLALSLIAIELRMMVLLRRLHQRTHFSSTRLMTYALVISVFGHVVRAVLFLLGHPPYDPRELDAWPTVMVACWVVSFILMFIGGLGYLVDKAQKNASEARLREQAAQFERERALDDVRRRDEMLIDGSRLATAAAASVYTSSIIHEISQPLQTIRLTLDAMADNAKKTPLPPALAQDLNAMLDLIGQATGVVSTFHGLLVKGRLKAGPVDVRVALSDVVHVIEAEARRREIEVRVEIDQTAPLVVYGDRVMIQRVLFNLAANAMDELCEAGAPALLSVHLARIEEEQQAWVELTVCDNGRGMSPRMLERLERGWLSTKDTGMGLGLKLIRELVGQWHGKMLFAAAQEGPGERPGTCVRVRLMPYLAGQ